MYIRCASATAFSLGLLSGLAQASTKANVTSALDLAYLSSGTQIFYPSDSNYTSETIQRWTIFHEPTYVASVKPATEEDVVKIINACVANEIPFLATGGAHGFTTTYDKLQNGLQIDMGDLKKVDVDANSSTLTIGPGVIFGEVTQPVYDAGFEVLTGSSICVGMIGATIGGGVGRYNGLHGMIVDSLLSVDIVTANGTRLTASKSENPDLFWAVRGAGANYGVIVSATYQIYPLTSQKVMNWDLAYPINQTEPIMKWFKSLEDKQDPKLAPILSTQYSEELYGGFALALNLVYIGSKDEGLKAVQSLINSTGTPLRSNLSEPTFAELSTTAFFSAESGPDACAKGSNYNVYGGSVDKYDIDAFSQFYQNMKTFYEQTPNAQNSIFFIEHFAKSGAEMLPEDSTSYPWRNITAHLLYNYFYNETSLNDSIDRFGKEQRALLQNSSGFMPEEIYVSYGHGDEGVEAWYGSDLARLSALKTTWDPNDVFSFNNAVPQAS